MNMQVHEHFMHSVSAADPAFIDHLAQRRSQLMDHIDSAMKQIHQQDQGKRDDVAWLTRTYPVLAILAPVMTTSVGNIEYPGDPMCLYSALSVAIDQVVKARNAGLSSDVIPGTNGEYIYADLCPRWGLLPSKDYRLSITDNGIRDYTSASVNTDQSIFDPRVWNERIKQYFVNYVLKVVQPKVVLISCVSPAHRYAIDIARLVRQHLPNTFIIFGGRHIDETMRFDDEAKKFTLAYSSTLQAILDQRIEPVVDFVVSGDGYFALDLLMKAISVSMDLSQKTATVHEVVRSLEKLASMTGPVAGRAVIAALTDKQVIHVFPIRGPRFDLAQLPSPYQAAAIRARFPIFCNQDNEVSRTAHIMTASSCPYHCDFCSEGMAVIKQLHHFRQDPVNSAVKRVLEYISYGAEALFFDDSIFWTGNMKLMIEFSTALARVKQEAMNASPDQFPWLQDDGDMNRLIKLQWGVQLTAEFLTSFYSRDKVLECLTMMRAAGCSYIYMGIESLASSIMNKIHKNRHKVGGPSWAEKIRNALMIIREANIRVGSSVLFGLDGETRETIEVTIEGVGEFIEEGLLYLASPNILTYHPATMITRQHGKEDHLDYHTLDVPNQPPYIYFEEAFPGVVSRELNQDDIWYIHRLTKERWGHGRYTEPMHLSEVK